MRAYGLSEGASFYQPAPPDAREHLQGTPAPATAPRAPEAPKPQRRSKALACGAVLRPDGDLVGLPVSGPCTACGMGTGDQGAHAPEDGDGRLLLLCRSCCPICGGDR